MKKQVVCLNSDWSGWDNGVYNGLNPSKGQIYEVDGSLSIGRHDFFYLKGFNTAMSDGKRVCFNVKFFSEVMWMRGEEKIQKFIEENNINQLQ